MPKQVSKLKLDTDKRSDKAAAAAPKTKPSNPEPEFDEPKDDTTESEAEPKPNQKACLKIRKQHPKMRLQKRRSGTKIKLSCILVTKRRKNWNQKLWKRR